MAKPLGLTPEQIKRLTAPKDWVTGEPVTERASPRGLPRQRPGLYDPEELEKTEQPEKDPELEALAATAEHEADMERLLQQTHYEAGVPGAAAPVPRVTYELNKDGTVNVISTDGKETGSVPEEEALELFNTGEYMPLKREDALRIVEQEKEQKDIEESGGEAFASGALRGVTFGLSDYGLPEYEQERQRKLKEAHPGASIAGDILGTGASLFYGGPALRGAGALGAATTRFFIPKTAATIAAKMAPVAAKVSGAVARMGPKAQWLGRVGAESAAVGFGQELSRSSLEQRPFDWGNAAENTGIMMGAAGVLTVAGKGVAAAGRKISPFAKRQLGKILDKERKVYNLTKDVAAAEAAIAENPLHRGLTLNINYDIDYAAEQIAKAVDKVELGTITSNQAKNIINKIKNDANRALNAEKRIATSLDETAIESLGKSADLEILKLARAAENTSLATDLAKGVVGRQVIGGLLGYGAVGGLPGAITGAALGYLTKNPEVRMLTYKLFRGTYEMVPKVGANIYRVLDIPLTTLFGPTAPLAPIEWSKLLTGTGAAATMKILTAEEMDEVNEELNSITPASVYKQQFSGFVAGGMDTKSAAELAAYKAKGVEFLKNNFPKDKLDIAARVKFSKMANAISNMPFALQRIDNMTASNEDIEVAKIMLGDVGFRMIQHQAEIRLKSDKKLTQKERAFLNRLLGETSNKNTLLIQESAYQAEQKKPGQLGPGPEVPTQMQKPIGG